MAAPDLTGRTISATYKDLLQVSNSNAGVDGSSRAVQDGEGTVSAMELSTAGLKSTGTLEVTGNTTLSGDLTLGTTTSVSAVRDEDDMSSDSSSSLATQQSIKKYVDDQVAGKDHLSELAGDSDDVSEGGTNRYVTTDQEDALAGTNGTPNASNPFVTNTDSRLTDSRNPDGSAGGDLSGTYPDPTVAKLQGRDMASTAPSDGQVVAWNNTTSKWEPTTSSGSGTVTSVTGGNGLSGGEITGSGTLAVDIDGATDGTAITVADSTDEMLLWDATDSTVKKITVDQLPGASGGIASVAADSSPQLGGFLDPNSNYIGMGKGTDIASATPTVPTDGDYFDVTGTTTIGTITVAVNRHFFLQFDGALELTHDATNLDLPGEASITTAAGDVAEFFSHTANQVQCVNYTKADGTAVVGGASGEANQNAWGIITVPAGTTTQTAAEDADSIAFTAGGGMTITGGTDTIAFSSANTMGTGFTVAATTTGTGTTITQGDSLTIAAGTGITTTGTSDGVVTIASTVTDTTYTAGDGLTLNVQEFNADLATNPGLKLTASDGSGKLALDLDSLSLDSTVDSTGWSEGDQIAVIDSATTDDPTKKTFLPAEIGIACSDESTAITPAEVKATIMVPRKMKVTEVKVSLTTPDSSGGGLQVQVHDHGSSPANSGTSMLTSAINTSDGYYATSTTFAGGWDQVLDANHFVKVEVTNLGMGASAGLKVWLLGYWA